MRLIKYLSALILLTQTVQAQKVIVNEFAAIDKKALQIPDSLTVTTSGISRYITTNFTTDKERVRAIFVWLASSIQYDIDNMYAINFYETEDDKINKPLKTRKGICENYAALFNDICHKSGIGSYVVEGYTKQNGFADYIPHAWCAAFVDSAWFLFDPTWGSGYVSNGKFYKKIDNAYFKAKPAAFIKSHMPFDYLWQFLNYPVTNQEFYEGKTAPNTAKPFFNFIDSISSYERLSHPEQLAAAAGRIEKNGIKNALVFDRLQHIKVEMENNRIQAENARQNAIVNLYNSDVADYNHAINDMNAFIDYRNHQFTPEKPDTEIQDMLDTVTKRLANAKSKLGQVKSPDANLASSMAQLTKSIADINTQLNEQQEWLKVYSSKTEKKRKQMFYEKKITWFGIPVN
jgi:predicted  nucleic acid-binding Zn-ribbon protein